MPTSRAAFLADVSILALGVALLGVGVGLSVGFGWGVASAGAAILVEQWRPDAGKAPR